MSTPNPKPARLAGTGDPRLIRVLEALRTRALPRESVDSIAGVSNGPDIIMRLRAWGLEIPCTRAPARDRDGRTRYPGTYSLTVQDRVWAAHGLNTRQEGGCSLKPMSMDELLAPPCGDEVPELLRDAAICAENRALASAAWRIADASALLRRRMRLRGFQTAEGFDEPTGRQAFLGGTLAQLRTLGNEGEPT